MFPVEGTEVPEGYNGWLLFLDEFNSAPLSVQAAAYKLTLDRQVGQYSLHDKCVCITAGNLATDGAIVEDLSTAMQSRLIHFNLDVDFNEWLNWAYDNNIDPRVTSYLNYSPDKLHSFDPDHNDLTFQCPRTWHFMSKLLTDVDIVDYTLLPLLEGTLGSGGREFLTFCELEKDLPKFKDILSKPEKVSIPKEPSVLYFLCGSIAAKLTVDNIETINKYIDRLDMEFKVILYRDALKRNKDLLRTKVLSEWISKNSTELFSNS